LFSLAADATDFTLSGLDGNAEGSYDVDGVILVGATATSLSWLCNGLATNIKSSYTAVDTGLGVTRGTAGLFTDAIAWDAPTFVNVHARVRAQRTINGVAAYVSIETRANVISDEAAVFDYAYISNMSWREATTNLTSLVLHASAASMLLTGSYLVVTPLGIKPPA